VELSTCGACAAIRILSLFAHLRSTHLVHQPVGVPESLCTDARQHLLVVLVGVGHKPRANGAAVVLLHRPAGLWRLMRSVVCSGGQEGSSRPDRRAGATAPAVAAAGSSGATGSCCGASACPGPPSRRSLLISHTAAPVWRPCRLGAPGEVTGLAPELAIDMARCCCSLCRAAHPRKGWERDGGCRDLLQLLGRARLLPIDRCKLPESVAKRMSAGQRHLPARASLPHVQSLTEHYGRSSVLHDLRHPYTCDQRGRCSTKATKTGRSRPASRPRVPVSTPLPSADV